MLVMTVGRKLCVDRLAFRPDGQALVAVAGSGVFLWSEIVDGLRARSFLGPVFNHDARFAGRWIVSALTDLYRIDPEAEDGLYRTDAESESAGLLHVPLSGSGYAKFDVSPDGERVVVVQPIRIDDVPHMRVTMWHTDTFAAEAKIWEFDRPGHSPFAPQFLPSGKRFARIDRTRLRVVTHDAETGAVWSEAPVPAVNSNETCVSPDVHWLALRGTTQIDVYPLHPDYGTAGVLRSDGLKHFTGFAFHPNGRFLAATNNDNTVKLFDVTSGTEVRTFTWQLGRMRSVCFSPDGTLAAAGSDKGQVVVWDVDV